MDSIARLRTFVVEFTRRNTFSETNGVARDFVSGYANPVTPNLWRRSA